MLVFSIAKPANDAIEEPSSTAISFAISKEQFNILPLFVPAITATGALISLLIMLVDTNLKFTS